MTPELIKHIDVLCSKHPCIRVEFELLYQMIRLKCGDKLIYYLDMYAKLKSRGYSYARAASTVEFSADAYNLSNELSVAVERASNASMSLANTLDTFNTLCGKMQNQASVIASEDLDLLYYEVEEFLKVYKRYPTKPEAVLIRFLIDTCNIDDLIEVFVVAVEQANAEL